MMLGTTKERAMLHFTDELDGAAYKNNNYKL